MKRSQKIVLWWLLLVGSIVGTPNISKAMQNIKSNAQTELSNKLSLSDIMKKYFEKNISINSKKVDFDGWETNAELITDAVNDRKMYLVYNNKFDGLWIQDDKTIRIKIAFEIIAEKNNYYIKFDIQNSDFDGDLVLEDDGLILDDVVYDIIVPDDNQKNTDLRIFPNSEKTMNRIKAKMNAIQLQSFVDIKENPEFEKTQLTDLNNISLSEQINKENYVYSRDLYLPDINRWQYLPIAKVFFDKKWNIDTKKTLEEYNLTIQANPFKVLGEILKLEMWLSKDWKKFQIKIAQSSIEALETRLKTHRNKLILYIDKAKIGAKSKFSEFNKIDKERPWHKWEKKFLFETSFLELDLINDTYILNSSRSDDKDIKFGFDYDDNPNNDKVYIKNWLWNKSEAGLKLDWKWNISSVNNAFDIEMDPNNIYNVFDNSGNLTIFKSSNSANLLPKLNPEFVWDWARYITNKSNLYYYDKEDKQMQYFNQKDWKKIASIPLVRDQKNQWKVGDISQDVYTDDLINVSRFSKTALQKLNLSQEDIKNIFLALMQKEDIRLQWRQTIRILVDSKDWKYEYYKVRQWVGGNPISLDKDNDLYESADKVMETIQKKLDLISKIENIQLWLLNGSKSERLEWAIWWGRWLEKGSLSTENKLSFLKWESNVFSQEVFWGEWESTSFDYLVKKTWALSLILKDSKAIKLDGTWFLKKRINSKLNIQNYKVSFEEWSKVFKLTFEAK